MALVDPVEGEDGSRVHGVGEQRLDRVSYRWA
jgi:hypothetical protein